MPMAIRSNVPGAQNPVAAGRRPARRGASALAAGLMAVGYLAFASGMAFADSATVAPAAPQAAATAALPAPTPAVAPDAQAGPKLVTTTFFDSDIREAIKEISLETGTNIVLDANVTGTVTVDLKDAPVEKALRMVLIGGGFSFRKIDDFYLCGLPDPKNPIFRDLSETQVYRFQNTTADSARSLLATAFLPYVQFDLDRNVANVTGSRETIDRVVADLQRLDTRRPQIRVKAIVTDVSREVLKEWGLDISKLAVNQGQTLNPSWVADLGLSSGVSTIDTDAFGQISAKLRDYERQNKAKIDADPVVVVADGKTGQLFVGDTRDVPTGAVDTNGNAIQQSVQAGVTLKVTPHIVGGNIFIDLDQKVSDFVQQTGANPVLKSAELTSTVSIAPGQSVIVGSVTRTTTSDVSTKVPLLGDIPLVRLLFKQTNSRKWDGELLIVMTAELVNP